MEKQTAIPERQDVADSLVQRLVIGFGRAFRRRCPYCGHRGVFDGWFSLKKQCPFCHTTYAYEHGYFLGAYAINLVVTETVAAAIVIGLIVYTDLTVLQMQIAAVIFAVGLPILFYPIALLLWVALDVAFNPPGKGTGSRAL